MNLDNELNDEPARDIDVEIPEEPEPEINDNNAFSIGKSLEFL